MPKASSLPDFSLFLSILHTLENIKAPYMIIGAFAATIYGITRTTYDIDIVVDLNETHIQKLVAAYPLPRYYADPDQMRDSIQKGIMFNIIDSSRGEKADLVPLSMDTRYRQAFQHRIRQSIDLPDSEPFVVWCARPEDVIIGKLMAWSEGQSRRHETDIYEMLIYIYLNFDPPLSTTFNENYVTSQATEISQQVTELWQSIQSSARQASQKQ
ncbi:MAG: nucleotidyl transferase AbiEii/AbiGii toxin family protein [Anaerolineae bacterium]|nr:nucleotidyl transferase AbiEii/AbiGii toxin family protein [Anaerolineae bacterium]